MKHQDKQLLAITITMLEYKKSSTERHYLMLNRLATSENNVIKLTRVLIDLP